MYFIDDKKYEKTILELYSALKKLNHEIKLNNTRVVQKKGIRNSLKSLLSNSPKELVKRLRIKMGHRQVNDPTVLLKPTNPKVSPFSNSRIAVYTSTFGGAFEIKDPLFIPDNCDFFYIGDKELAEDSIWKTTKNEEVFPYINNMSNLDKNRFVKMNPHIIFPEYEYSVYIDGNILLVGDPTEFINLISNFGLAFYKHRARECIYDELDTILKLKKATEKDVIFLKQFFIREGMPLKKGLIECNIIARDHKNQKMKTIMEEWWNLFLQSNIKRDQIFLPYVLMKNKVEVTSISTLGDNVYNSDIIQIVSL